METHAHPHHHPHDRHYHPHNRVAGIGAVLAAVLALLLCAAILSMQDWWRPLLGIDRETTAPVASMCHRCGIVEAVRTMDRAEMSASHGVAIRGFGDDLLSVLAVIAGALTGNRLQGNPGAPAIHEVTVRFEDGSSRVLRISGGRNWKRGDRVKVIQGRLQAAG